MSPAKKRSTKKKTPAAAEPAKPESGADEPEPVVAVGPSETTVDKGADEFWWFCPHCDTRYPKGAKIAQANHLDRVHPGVK